MVFSGIQDLKYEEYKSEVISKLLEEIKAKGSTKKTEVYYRFPDPEYDNYFYTFDLVEYIESNGTKVLKNIYEICPASSVEKNIHYMLRQMLNHKELTGADVTLAYFNEKGKLVTWSLAQLPDAIKSSKKLKPSTIDSFSGFYDAIDSKCGKEGSGLTFFFRGQPCKYKVIPGIFRNGNSKNEELLYHEAIRRNPKEFTEDMNTFDSLVKMQHYELPTRLLDITTNPLVALYFACQEAVDENGVEADGEVLVYSLLQDQIHYFDSDEVCVLANLAKRPKEFNPSVDQRWENLINDVKKDRPNFRGVPRTLVNEVLCVLPKLNNDRINNQYGAFFIFGMGDTKVEPALLRNQPDVINIDAGSKKDILKALALMGIDESTLFPETDKIMKQIRREYSVDVKVECKKNV